MFKNLFKRKKSERKCYYCCDEETAKAVSVLLLNAGQSGDIYINGVPYMIVVCQS